jgi:hypothetical protein
MIPEIRRIWTIFSLRFEQLFLEMYTKITASLENAVKRFEGILAIENMDSWEQDEMLGKNPDTMKSGEWALANPVHWLAEFLHSDMSRIRHSYVEGDKGVLGLSTEWIMESEELRALTKQMTQEDTRLSMALTTIGPVWSPYLYGDHEVLPMMPIMVPIPEASDIEAVLRDTELNLDLYERLSVVFLEQTS